MTVYFKVWDVDDPFNEMNTSIPDVGLIDSDASGPDNRPTGEAPWTASAPTDANGQASVTFTVSMQPGNNYRAGASLLQDALNQGPTGKTMQNVADALSVWTVEFTDENGPRQLHYPYGWFSDYRVPLVWSEMLTVWRKLTIEVDSMSAESQNIDERINGGVYEWDRCDVSSVSVDDPAPGFTTVECAVTDPARVAYPGTNFYEGGSFARNDTGEEFLIARSTPIPVRVVLWGDPGTDILGVSCVIRDDDLYFADPTSPRQLPHPSVLQDDVLVAFEDAYIEIVEADSTLNPRPQVSWLQNLSVIDLALDHDFLTGVCSQWDFDSADDYWARLVIMGYQSGVTDDGDSDNNENCAISQNCLALNAPYPLINLSPPLNGEAFHLGQTVRNTFLRSTATSAIFKETTRDQVTDPTSPEFWQIVAHEIGHATLNQSSSTAGTGVEHTEGGLMSSGDDLQNLPQLQKFSAESIRRFREARRW